MLRPFSSSIKTTADIDRAPRFAAPSRSSPFSLIHTATTSFEFDFPLAIGL